MIIGSNTSNNASFGNLSSISNCGIYEISSIISYSSSKSTVSSITVSGTLENTYNTGLNSSVQVFTFPTFGSPDYETAYSITAYPWDGEKGGVVAFNVEGTLTINHDIDVSRCGFRGATGQKDNVSGGCDGTNYIAANGNNFGLKGEGIYKNTTSGYEAGKGHLLNGGGGGNSHNGGGGGGGNYTAGGNGGPGWGSGSSPGSAAGACLLGTTLVRGR